MLLSTAALLQPLHNKTHQWDYVRCWFPVVLRSHRALHEWTRHLSSHTSLFMGDAFTFLALHCVHYGSTSPPGAHLCPMGYIFAPLLPTSPYRKITSPQVLVFCLVCSLLYPQLHELHSLNKTGFSEDLPSELAAGTCFWPAPPNRKHCTSRGVPTTAAGLLDASAVLRLSPTHHVPTLLWEFIHSW